MFRSGGGDIGKRKEKECVVEDIRNKSSQRMGETIAEAIIIQLKVGSSDRWNKLGAPKARKTDSGKNVK